MVPNEFCIVFKPLTDSLNSKEKRRVRIDARKSHELS